MILKTRITTIVIAALAVSTLGLATVPPASAVEIVLVSASSTWDHAVVSSGSCQGFEQVVDTSGCSFGTGGPIFGYEPNPDFCGFPAANTTWGLNSDLILVKTVVLPVGATGMRLDYSVDNDVKVWLNGGSSPVLNESYENCDGKNQSETVSLTPGTYKIAVRATDRGYISHFQMTVTAVG